MLCRYIGEENTFYKVERNNSGWNTDDLLSLSLAESEVTELYAQATKIQVIEKEAPMPYYHLINLLMTFSSV